MDYIALGQGKHEIIKAKLKLWLILGSIHDRIIEAVERKDFEGLASEIISYVSTAFSVPDIDELPWEEVIDAFIRVVNVNALGFEIPLLLATPEKDTEVPWDYPGRNWFFWSHTLCREFGWSLEYVGELEVEEGIKLLQEVLVSAQLEKEWEWVLSPQSVVYNKDGKGKFNKLDRPRWMGVGMKMLPPKIIEIPEFLRPVGNVIHAKH